MGDLLVERSAVISADGLYRTRLERFLGFSGPVIAGLMVNPSKADGEIDDPTITRWMGFGTRLKASRIIIGNKFAFRATDVRELRDAVDPIGSDNDRAIEQILRDADVHVVAWGPLSKLPPRLRDRWRDVLAIADRVGCQLKCWGMAKDGHPLHPLMLPYSAQLVDWVRP